jgi:hypothetical protein
MTRLVLLAAVLVSVTALGARAQKPPAPPDTATIAVSRARQITIPNDEALVAYVDETIVTSSGSFARVQVVYQDALHGPTRLTACDDVVVSCQAITMKVGGDTTQGSALVLRKAE